MLELLKKKLRKGVLKKKKTINFSFGFVPFLSLIDWPALHIFFVTFDNFYLQKNFTKF